MNSALAVAVTFAFVALALWHFHMARSLAKGESGAMPSVSGKPVFVPSAKATVAVGIVLLGFAMLVSATTGLWLPSLPRPVLVWLSYALSLGLLLRAIGEFKYVGFFKRVRGKPGHASHAHAGARQLTPKNKEVYTPGLTH